MKKILYISVLVSFLTFSCQKEPDVQNNPIADVNPKEVLDKVKNNDSLMYVALQLLEKNEADKAEKANQIALYFYNKSKLPLAHHFFNLSARYYLQNGDSVQYASQLGNLGVLNEIAGQYPEAIDNFLKALKIFKQNDMKLETAKIYNNIGTVYQEMNQPEKALDYYRQSLELTEKLNKPVNLASKYNNIGNIYEEQFHQLDSALYYYQKALEIYEKAKIKNPKAIIENNIANIYILQNEPASAVYWLNKALNTLAGTGDEKLKALVYRNWAKLYLTQKKYKEAEEYIRRALTVARQNKDKEVELEALKILAQIYEGRQDFEKAHQNLKDYYRLKSEIAGSEQKLKTEGLNIKYQVSEKEHKIKVLELENRLKNKRLVQMRLLVLALALILAGVFMFFKLKQKNAKIKLLQMQRDISNYMHRLENMEQKQEQTGQKTTEPIDDFDEKIKKFGLTTREKDVLKLIVQGYTNSEIAEKLFVSINTVKTHTKNIFVKMDVENRIKAARKIKM